MIGQNSLKLIIVFCITALFSVGIARASCNDPMAEPIGEVKLPGHAYMPVSSADGCWVYVSITQTDKGTSPGVAVLHRENGKTTLLQTAAILNGHPSGMTLSHDGKILVVSDKKDIVLFDVEKLNEGNSKTILGHFDVGAHRVTLTSDDHFLFAVDEGGGTITVVDFKKSKKLGLSSDLKSSIVGKIPLGPGAVAAELSPDEKKLYATSELAPASSGWPIKCREDGGPNQGKPPNHPEGAAYVIDVKKAETDPAHSILSMAPAGCVPTRLELSSAGDRAYVSVRQDGALLVFDVARLQSEPMQAQIGRIVLGTPIGLALIDNGAKAVVTDMQTESLSEEYKNKVLDIVDTSKISEGAAAVIGKISVGEYPRELSLSSDQRTLFLTNYFSNTLDVIDLGRLSSVMKK